MTRIEPLSPPMIGVLAPMTLPNARRSASVAVPAAVRGRGGVDRLLRHPPLHNSDSLMFSLASLYAWTPFFWEQDRVGMLVPLVASVCPDPVMNLVLQTGLDRVRGPVRPAAPGRIGLPAPGRPGGRDFRERGHARSWPRTAVRDNFLFECYYPLAMALGCAALLVLGRGPGWPRWWRVVAGGLLFGLAHWVYLGVPLWLGPLALVRGWVQPGEPWPAVGGGAAATRCPRRTVLGCGLLVAAFGLGSGLDEVGASPRTRISSRRRRRTGLPSDEWAESLVRVRSNAVTRAAGHGRVAGALSRPRGRSAWSRSCVPSAAVGRDSDPRGSSAYCSFRPQPSSSSLARAWTGRPNDHHPRYLLGSLESLQILLALFALLPRWRSRPRAPRVGAVRVSRRSRSSRPRPRLRVPFARSTAGRSWTRWRPMDRRT